jgi:conjugal transfer pilin signal peptidase TrbI
MKVSRVPLKVWTQVVVRCSVIALVLLGFSSRFGIGVNGEKVACLPYSAYLFDHALSAREPVRGALYLFDANGLMPFFKDGAHFLKMMAGLPGDHFEVDEQGIHINDQFFGAINEDILRIAHLTVGGIKRSGTIPPGHYLMLGTTPESYDGRYWGLITATQLTGRAYPLW